MAFLLAAFMFAPMVISPIVAGYNTQKNLNDVNQQISSVKDQTTKDKQLYDKLLKQNASLDVQIQAGIISSLSEHILLTKQLNSAVKTFNGSYQILQIIFLVITLIICGIMILSKLGVFETISESFWDIFSSGKKHASRHKINPLSNNNISAPVA